MTRIFISADKTKATVINKIGCEHSYTTTQSTFTISGTRWVTPLSCLLEDYPDATVLYEA